MTIKAGPILIKGVALLAAKYVFLMVILLITTTNIMPAVSPVSLAPILLRLSLDRALSLDMYPLILDTRASAHMSNESSILDQSTPYMCEEFFIMGNGAPLPISHSGPSLPHPTSNPKPIETQVTPPATTSTFRLGSHPMLTRAKKSVPGKPAARTLTMESATGSLTTVPLVAPGSVKSTVGSVNLTVDPRFIGGDGVLFYFHGKKDKDFCLVSDSNIHVNGHFIGKRSKKRRDFTWVQSIGVLFGSHQLYLGAREVGKWNESSDNMLIQLNGNYISIATRAGETWRSPEVGLSIRRISDCNEVVLEAEKFLKIAAKVVPVTEEESRLHGYDVDDDNCFAHLELNFKFNSLSPRVNGVLGQTYSPSYRSRVKMAAAMPIMGGRKKFASSHLFATDCAVSSFGSKAKEGNGCKPLSIACNRGISDGKGL
ncbi:uncharacterized protein [Aristolochia californica]|uniref:uncharacterized protein n=1 Tax=Aristolochia californica TaxID=171875 RepID=UPI0035DF8C16